MSEPSQNNESPKGKKSEGALRIVAPFLGMGMQLAAAVIVFFFIGSWIDDRYLISPYGKLIGGLLGFAGGFIKFVKTANELAKQSDSK
ncbi:MAG: AtpZ/AtpI family protein [Bacteroidota bacterium]